MLGLRPHGLRRAAVLLAVTLAGATPGPARAVGAEHVEWSGGYASSWCTNGVNSRICNYSLYVYDCTEASVVGLEIAGCYLEMHASAEVVPVLNAAGRVVGCTTTAAGGSGTVYYDSTFDQFDNDDISDVFRLHAYDTFGDGSAGALEFVALSGSNGGQYQPARWTVLGAMEATCGRAASVSSDVTTGSVDVQL